MRHAPARLALLVALTALLPACGTETTTPGTADDPPLRTPAALPDAVPAPGGAVTTGGLVTVLDDGHGAQLCLGLVAESLPPQCGGPAIAGWNWADHEGDYDEAAGTRWGEFVVTGTFDGVTVTPSEVIPADEHDAPPPSEEDPFLTLCPEPDGGWVVDPALLAREDLDAGFRAARQLDDYASSFVDNSLDPRSPEKMDQDAAAGHEDVSSWIVNVKVTGDPQAAEATVREAWGGGLCVTTADHTERELLRIQEDLRAAPGFLASGIGDDAVHLQVVHDDGRIQAWADGQYGEGVVVVSSALTEVD